MNERGNPTFSSIRVRTPLHLRAKSLAALAGKPLADFTNELLSPALDRAEKELSKLRGDRPNPGRTIE